MLHPLVYHMVSVRQKCPNYPAPACIMLTDQTESGSLCGKQAEPFERQQSEDAGTDLLVSTLHFQVVKSASEISVFLLSFGYRSEGCLSLLSTYLEVNFDLKAKSS